MLANTKQVIQWSVFVAIFLMCSCSIHRESNLNRRLFVQVRKNNPKQTTSSECKIEPNQNTALTQLQSKENGAKDEELKTDFSYTDEPSFTSVIAQETKDNPVQQEAQFSQKKKKEKRTTYKGKQKAVVGFVLPFIGALLGFTALILLMFSSVVVSFLVSIGIITAIGVTGLLLSIYALKQLNAQANTQSNKQINKSKHLSKGGVVLNIILLFIALCFFIAFLIIVF